jgi:hypothetical protein
MSTDTTIATAILAHLAALIDSDERARAFVRLEGFSEGTYRRLLTALAEQGGQVAGRPLLVRSIGPIEGHPQVAMEPDRSATWYRNHLPAGCTLLIILNRRTSDAQSLQDIYGISEQALTRDGIDKLIAACFEDYQLEASQRRILQEFVRHLRRLRLEPQLRDLAEFLRIVDQHMDQRPGTQLAEAIADALPALNLFRCRELATHLNTPRGDKLIRALKQAAQIGTEVLDDKVRQEYLSRLEKTDFADDSAFGGLKPEEKAELLRRFIDGTLGDDRAELLSALRIDWHEVQQIISSRGRVTKPERYLRLADRLVTAAAATQLAENTDLAEIVDNLREGREPDGEAIERVLNESGDTLQKVLRNDLRRMIRPRTRRNADFLVGLVALAVDLLHVRQGELAPGTQLRITLAPATLERSEHLHDAASVFQAIYGGLERVLPAFRWQLEPLWAIANTDAEAPDEEGEESERVSREEIAFRLALVGPDNAELAAGELIWQYRSDSPAAATALALAHESELLESDDYGPLFAAFSAQLRIPIYTSSQPIEEIGDLDLSHPLSSLGPWYEAPGNLRMVLERQLKPVARSQAWVPVEAALTALEQAWADFVIAARAGLLGAEVSTLLEAYQALLATGLASLTTGSEVGASYRLINQAWVIGPQGFTTWAIVPVLHPLKLLWWRERARYFGDLVSRLLSSAAPSPIVDVKRFQRELAATYGSSSFPPALALPRGEGRIAERFLPIEETEGYELYFHESASAEAFGLDTDLLAEDENELAALRAVEGIVAVVQDYVETYPFVRDGVEIFLFECRNGAVPGMLIEQLTKAGQLRGWSMRLSVIVHTSERGAPLFRRVSKWIASGRPGAERQDHAYFPPITVKVLQCTTEELFDQQEDTDIVVLADVLAERGQEVHSELEPLDGDDLPADGYMPTYRARQEPFQQGEQHRRILLSAPHQPTVARLFLLAQHAALDKQKRAPRAGNEARFYRDLTLEDWRPVIERLHDRFNWIICYDTSIDRFLLKEAFREKVQVIRYSLGLGAKRQHNLTVSSSGRAPAIVTRRLAARLGQMFPQAPTAFCDGVAARLVAEAEQISGDIVLRAAGPGAFLNELIGLVAAKFETERRYEAQHPGALRTWILLDDFEHWFGSGKFPDLLLVVIERGDSGQLKLHLQVLEAKCVGELSFESEALDAQEQVRQGVARLLPAFTPGASHLDALYWYDQLYRAVAGTLSVEPDQQELWELFRDQLHSGAFTLDLSGHTWAFCYDGQADVSSGPLEQPFSTKTGEAPEVSLQAHHYGRNELAALLHALILARGGPQASPEVWAQPPSVVNPARSSEARILSELVADTRIAPPADTAATNASSPDRRSITIQPVAQGTPVGGSTEPVAPVITDTERQWLTEKARDLERALRRRGVQLQPINPADADVGPSIVRFKLRLSGSETIKKLQAAAIDLARDLALIRTPFIDNVLGTNFVGVDLPRPWPETVDLLALLQGLSHPSPGELPTIIGMTPDGHLHIEDLSEFPHLLVAGATGSGKSVFLRSVLLGLMTVYRPGGVELLVVDPKQTDFSFFDGLPYLRGGKVFTQAEEARDALLELVRSEMPRRQQLMRGRSLKIKDFNKRFPHEALPPIVAMIDEYAQLLSIQTKKDADSFERDLMSLAAVARSTGIHLILATQRPSVNVVTGTLKANLPTRIAFQVPTNNDSRVVLDTPGAENLLGRGDMLFRRSSGEIVRLQAPFMGEEQMQSYIATLAAAGYAGSDRS